MKNHEECQGCLLKQSIPLYKCTIKEDAIKCPCQLCMIKGICRNPCESFIEFLLDILKNEILSKEYENGELTKVLIQGTRGSAARYLEARAKDIQYLKTFSIKSESNFELTRIRLLDEFPDPDVVEVIELI